MNPDTLDAEDTAFYAQITKQILLLMDEDDVTHGDRTTKGTPELGWGGFGDGRPMYYGKQFGWMEGGRRLEVPGWMESLWVNNGAGTGVFIPRGVAVADAKPRRKRHHRSRKNKNGGRVDLSEEQKVHA